MKLLVPAFLLLVLSDPATAEVVQSFTTCDDFFVTRKPPSGLQGTHICQIKTQAASYQFATLYDISQRIPIYSAYRFHGKATCQRKNTWDIEPQLDDQNSGPFMASEGSVSITKRGVHQALNGDYTSTTYDKGHLVPVQHQQSQSCADATFTLTNAAPQHNTFNRGQWKAAEGRTAVTLTINCLNRGFSAYIITGVVPGNININARVNIPKYFWSAYCCVDNNDRPQLSNAYYGNNDATNKVTPITVANLDIMLGRDYQSPGFELFPNHCV
ncbi:hypothetical protein PAMP_002521 [Pampus punctatissimus]